MKNPFRKMSKKRNPTKNNPASSSGFLNVLNIRVFWVTMVFRIVLLLTGILFIFFALMILTTCSMSLPPQCGTLMEAAPCFSVSIICFILFFYLGRIEESEVADEE